MQSFLQIVANDLRQRMGNNLSNVIVVFPNKRASLFLNECLLPPGEKPIWAPRYMAINEFFRTLTATRVADPIETVCRLYRHYVRFTGSTESLDTFYGWGERLLSDFDDLDKSMAPAEEVFANLKDFAGIDETNSCLTDEQVEQLHRFADAFGQENPGVVRGRFLNLWQQMLPIYQALRAELSAEGLAYEGQLYREVATAVAEGSVALPEGCTTVAFVGLNVLNESERTLFRTLQSQGKALFYWDYDTSYANIAGTQHTEAGVFMQQNLLDFPNAISEEDANFNNFLQHRADGTRSIEFVSAPNETSQAQSVKSWLADPQNFNTSEARQTAIVLCNEALLQPVLHALPTNVGKVNITKGFPLSHTPAYTLITQKGEELLLKMSEDAHDGGKKRKAAAQAAGSAETAASLIALLQQMQQWVTDEAALKHTDVSEDSFLGMLYTESYYQTYTTLSRFISLVEKGHLLVNCYTLFRLLRETLSLQSIPFHGEPATGLQVMGVLETRCLDFKRVLMLSVSEGMLPQRASEASFVPYLIRKHFGMTTSEHKTSVYAYYFHRLLQRAERVRLTFNDMGEGMNKSEMSRFMKALLLEGNVPITRLQLAATPRPRAFVMESAPKPADMAERVMKEVSPTKINTYMRCPMSFYFKYVLNLKDKSEEEGIISARDFGTVLHRAAELFYTDMQTLHPESIHPAHLQEFLNDNANAAIENYVRRAFVDSKVEENDLSIFAIKKYLRNIIEYEAGNIASAEEPAQSFHIPQNPEGKLTLEHNTEVMIHVPYGHDGEMSADVLLKGNIDRLDEAVLGDGKRHLRIIDYKTGGQMETVADIEALFTPGSSHPHYALQTFLYALTLVDGATLPIAPALYFVNHLHGKDFSPFIKFAKEPMLDFAEIADEFRERFTLLLAEMLDPNIRFVTTKVAYNCKSCAYATLCGKG